MATCTSCGGDVTGKKFCPECGTAVQPANGSASTSNCPRCNGEVRTGAAFCMHCGSTLNAPVQTTYAAPPPPPIRPCPACHTQVAPESAFCTSCGHNMNAPVAAAPSGAFCTNCGRQNGPDVRFCGGCGSPIGAPAAQPGAMMPGQYPAQPQYPQQYGQAQYPQQYAQGGYQPQPMLGQQPMVLRCPTCMAQAPMGTAQCVSCRTSLAGVVPTPAGMPMQGQQGGLGGFLQGDGGKYAMGALGGVVALGGAEMLLHGLENSVENRVEGDLGYPRRHHHRDEGLLGGLGELANDIGLL